MADSTRVSDLIKALRQGDRAAFDALFSLVYEQLRSAAHRQLSSQNPGRTLNTTALVHETYLKMARASALSAVDRGHFFRLAAKAMRQILVDHARGHLAKKRGGEWIRVDTDVAGLALEQRAGEMVSLDRALESLAAMDGRLAEVVELRFFAGLTVQETGAALGVAPRTVKRDWQKARMYLNRAMSDEAFPANPGGV
jgi:RNA polymerase sigma factor (TIGR02999 family)